MLAAQLRANSERITAHVLEADYRRRPILVDRYGERGRELYARDNAYHVDFLAEAIANAEPALFVDYVAWAKSLLFAHGVLTEDLVHNLELLKEAVGAVLGADFAARALGPVDDALAQLPRQPLEPPSFLDDEAPHATLARDYLAHLLNGERRLATELVITAVADGVPLRDVYLDVFQRTQREIGRLWQLNRITVAQEHFCTAATLAAMNQFYRDILAGPRNGRRVVCACVAGDLHEIGLRIVADFFELDGWDCDYIGANKPATDLVRTLASKPPDLIAIAATMTYHVDAIRSLIGCLRAEPGLAGVPVLVGGRPFLIAADLWKEIGADGSALDALEAVALGNRLTA